MDKEIERLYENKAWKLVEKVKGKEVLDVKWVYRRKSDDRYKARLVAREFQQRNVADNIYSPVASNQTFKILLSYCCQNGLILEQMDVETAFLNGEVTSEVYVSQPKGYVDGTNRVCKLSKALYGLKESPRDWYECIDWYVTRLGFKKNNIELCLYTHGGGENVVYLLIYVDDSLICSKNKRKIQSVKKLLTNRFEMEDLGEVKEYLEINIEYYYFKNEMRLSQKKYIESLANKYKLQNGNCTVHLWRPS